MDFGQMKEKFKDNEDFTSALTQLEAEFTTLSGKKETAVENEIKLRNTKQEIAKALGLEENTPANDLVGKISETLTGYKTKIDSFEKTASSKDLENASVKEQLSTLTTQLNDYTTKLQEAEATNTLNSLKSQAREALAKNRITDPSAQDMAINANMSQLSNVEDFGAFAKSIAEQSPFLTDTVHKGGSGTTGATYNNNTANLGNIDPKDAKARTQAIQARLEAQGLA
jgi:hypothetical protein